MTNKELELISNRLSNLKSVELKDVKYLDPTSITVDGKSYFIESRNLERILSGCFGFPNYTTCRNIYKMSPEIWRSCLSRPIDDSMDLSNSIYLEDDKVVAISNISDKLPMASLIDNLNSRDYDIRVYNNDDDRLDFSVASSINEPYSIGVVYYIDQNYIEVYTMLDVDFSGIPYLVVLSKALYSKYITSEISDIEELIVSELESSSALEILDVVSEEMSIVSDTLESSISIEELMSNFDKWFGKVHLADLMTDSEFSDLIPPSLKDKLDKFLLEFESDIPSNRLKRSVSFVDSITYGDLLLLAKSLLWHRVINISQYISYQDSILKSRTNWDYLK